MAKTDEEILTITEKEMQTIATVRKSLCDLYDFNILAEIVSIEENELVIEYDIFGKTEYVTINRNTLLWKI